ncbi:MAG: P-loop NTPase [Thermodesulfovibrionales bacterium]
MEPFLFPGNGGPGKKRKCEIWAVGGGKGGTGKTFLTSALGTCLALRRKKVILVDADLGGCNLHTLFGIPKPYRSLSDFIERKARLEDLVVPSGVAGLGLISGNPGSLDSGSIKHAQKLKLFRHIGALDADFVIMDLGAGSHVNTLDAFLIADKKIVAITPEITAIENLYQFIKAALFRKLKTSPAVEDIKGVFQRVWERRAELGIRHLRDLVARIAEASPQAGAIVERELRDFNIHVVLNQVKSAQSIQVGASVKSVCIKHMGFMASYPGFVNFDEGVARSINSRQPLMRAQPRSECARQIERLADNLLGRRQVTLAPVEYARARG